MNSHISLTGQEMYEMALLWTDLSLLAQQRTKLSQNRNQLSCFYKNFRILWNVLFSPPFPTREKKQFTQEIRGKRCSFYLLFFVQFICFMCNVCVLCGLVKCHEIRRALGVLPFPAFSSAIQKNNTHFKPIYDATVQVAKVYPLYRSFLACKSALGLLLFLWRLARSKSLWLTSVLIKYSMISFRIKIIWYL